MIFTQRVYGNPHGYATPNRSSRKPKFRICPKRLIDLLTIAPELVFKFRVAITAEGERPSDEVLDTDK